MILIVDDEVKILTALRRTLRREGYVILTAESPEQAIALLEETNVDLVLSDQKMPGMCGVELLAEAKRLRPEASRLLITGCQLFYTYHITMHQRTRQVVQSFLSDIVEPDFVLEGAEEEFRPYLEARALEDKDSGQGLLFIMNRDPSKGYSLKVNVKGYNPVTVEVPSYDVVRVKLAGKE